MNKSQESWVYQPAQLYPPPQYNAENSHYKEEHSRSNLQDTNRQSPQQNVSQSVSTAYHDLWASLLFCASFCVFVAFSVIGIRSFSTVNQASNQSSTSSLFFNESNSGNNATGNFTLSPAETQALFAGLGSGSVLAVFLSAGYVGLLKLFPDSMIKLTFMLSIVLTLAMGVISIFFGSVIVAIINIFFALWCIIYYIIVRKRIPLASAILSSVCRINEKYPATYGIAVLGSIISFGFFSWWLFTVVGITNRYSGNSLEWLLILYLLFTGYWVGQVFNNVVNVTISGTVASFYYLGGTAMMPTNPTLSSFKRAVTYSFGPICFGSLIVAIIQTVRAILQSAARQGSIIAACAACLLGCIEGLVEYFNAYAYVHVAIYGKSFCESAKDTWNLVKRAGIDAIINDSLIGTCLSMGSFMVGLLAGTLSYIVGYLVLDIMKAPNDSISSSILIGLAFAVAAVGFMIMGLVTVVIDAGTHTTFVILAETPEAIARVNPDMFEKFRQVYPQIQWRV